jgi:hypothetical protein
MRARILSLYPTSIFLLRPPEEEELQTMMQPFDMWIFDDLCSELQNCKSFTNFFTKWVHHLKQEEGGVLMVYITQNPYEKGSDAVTRARNCGYHAYFPNNGDMRWEKNMGDQLLGNAKLFRKMFAYATENRENSCLLVDCRPGNPRDNKFIMNPFFSSEEDPVQILIPST